MIKLSMLITEPRVVECLHMENFSTRV